MSSAAFIAANLKAPSEYALASIAVLIVGARAGPCRDRAQFLLSKATRARWRMMH
jgi:hypothetical protein